MRGGSRGHHGGGRGGSWAHGRDGSGRGRDGRDGRDGSGRGRDGRGRDSGRGEGRRGGGRRGGRGGGGGGGREQQRWWDPVWREQKLRALAEARGPSVPVDEAKWREAFQRLASQSQASQPAQPADQTLNPEEIVIGENVGREGTDILRQLAEESGLYFHAYGKGTGTVCVASRVPLPNYRADLDTRHGRTEREISMSADTHARVATLIGSSSSADPMHAPQTHVVMTNGTADPMQGVSYHTSGSAEGYHGGIGLSGAAGVVEGQSGAVPQTAAAGAQANSQQTAVQPSPNEMRWNEEMRRRQRDWQASSAAQPLMAQRNRLPAFSQRQQLLQAVEQNQVLVVSGETGCGKTTQLPQFILEQAIEENRGGSVSIICTQPRRISATSVAARVAAERGEEVGGSVGYQIRLESRRSEKTRLLFCTTGVLLRRLVQDPLLRGVSHVMVDEIHERGINEDFLLIILRDLLPQRPDLRVVLMSATINAQLFSQYFGNAPMAHIPGFTYPVQQLFLEDVLEASRLSLMPIQGEGAGQFGGRGRGRGERGWKKDEGRGKKEIDPIGELWESTDVYSRYTSLSILTRQSLQNWSSDKLNVDFVADVVEYICASQPPGAVLVFLTGWDEISKVLDALKLRPTAGQPSKTLLLPLHGSMPTVYQREIFNRPPVGVRKVIISTNIAETSITVDDVVFVVDCGKAKETSYDALNKLACLQPTWSSKASVHQRRGRAGRVQPGVCYHLFPRAVYDALPEFQLPEILRTPLQELCLQIKHLGLGQIKTFLAKAMNPPEPKAVDNAIALLHTIGALDASENLTALGCHLAMIPVEPQIGKMLLYSCMFNCLSPALTIAASLAYRDPFVLPIDKKDAADRAKQAFAGGSCSDHIALLRAFNQWQLAKRQGRERQFCWDNFLSAPTLQMISDMRTQFLDLLSDIGFYDKDLGLQEFSGYENDMELLAAVLCAGMFPAVARIKRMGKRCGFYTKDDGKVSIHPSSVNGFNHHFPHTWLLYSNKVKTSDIYLRDTTCVSDFGLLLLGGPLEPPGSGQPGFDMLGGYMHFAASPATAALVQRLRTQLDDLLRRKVQNPSFDLHKEGSHVVAAVRELLYG